MRSVLLTLFILFSFNASCLAAQDVKKAVQKGNLLYNKGEFPQALKQYEQALLNSPDSDIVNYNLGAALYKTEDYPAAAGHFERALVSPDPAVEQKASYNLGNARYKYGIGYEDKDLPKAIELLQQSLQHYQRALELEPKDADAQYNYELVKKELERLQKKLEQKQKEKQQKQQQQQPQKEQKEQQNQQQQKEQHEQQKEQQQKEPQPQEQQPKQGEEQEQSPQEKERAESQSPQQQKEQEPSATQTEQAQNPEEMSVQEAQMLLDGYTHEEEPKGLYQEKLPTRGLPEVLKDW